MYSSCMCSYYTFIVYYSSYICISCMHLLHMYCIIKERNGDVKIFDWSRATTVVYTIYMYTVSLSYVYVLYILSYTNE